MAGIRVKHHTKHARTPSSGLRSAAPLGLDCGRPPPRWLCARPKLCTWRRRYVRRASRRWPALQPAAQSLRRPLQPLCSSKHEQIKACERRSQHSSCQGGARLYTWPRAFTALSSCATVTGGPAPPALSASDAYTTSVPLARVASPLSSSSAAFACSDKQTERSVSCAPRCAPRRLSLSARTHQLLDCVGVQIAQHVQGSNKAAGQGREHSYVCTPSSPARRTRRCAQASS
jgi:hypothetical protein